jgi:hypothetical protein
MLLKGNCVFSFLRFCRTYGPRRGLRLSGTLVVPLRCAIRDRTRWSSRDYTERLAAKAQLRIGLYSLTPGCLGA